MNVESESEVAQLCLTLWDPMDYSPPGSSIHEIFQARVLEWVAIAFFDTLTHTYIYIWSTQVWTEQVHIFLFNKYTLSQFILGCGTCRYGGPLWDLRILGFWYPQRWILEPVPCGYWRMIVTWSERNWLYYYLLLLSLDAPISCNRMRCISLLTS